MQPGYVQEPERRAGRGKAWWRIAAVAACAGAAWWGVFVGLKAILPGARPERTWSVAESPRVPPDFVFLMFPVNDTVSIFDSAGGKQVGLLERAVGNEYNEVVGRQWIQVPKGAPDGSNAFVRLADLRYLSAAAVGKAPPLATGETSQDRVNYVGNFAKSYLARNPEAQRSATFMRYTNVPPAVEREAKAVGGEGDIVALTLGEFGNRRIFWAKATFEKATPLAIDRLTAGSRDGARFLRIVISGMLATIGAAVIGVGAWTLLGRAWR